MAKQLISDNDAKRLLMVKAGPPSMKMTADSYAESHSLKRAPSKIPCAIRDSDGSTDWHARCTRLKS